MEINKKKITTSILFAFISSIALNMSLAIVTDDTIKASLGMDNPGTLFKLLWDLKISMNGYSTTALIMVIALSLLIYTIWQHEEGFSLVSLITSFIFAFFEVFGQAFMTASSWDPIFNSGRCLVKAAITYAGFTVLFYFLIRGVYILFKNITFIKNDKSVNSWFTDNRKSLFAVAGIIMLMWLPYYISAFPGLTNYDFFDMLDTFYGNNTNSLRVVVPIDPSVTLNNNNPVIQTLWAVFVMKIGNMLGSPYIGLFIFIIIQEILFALVLSHVIRWLARKNINKIIRIGLLLLYGLLPVHANYAISTLKDTNFSFVTILYLLLVIDMVLDSDKFVSEKSNLIKLALITLLMMFLRNNGLYIIALSAVAFLIAYRKHFKKLVLPMLVPIIIFELVTGVVYPALKITPGFEAEALSIPLQQVSRLVVEHEDALTNEDKDIINGIINYDQIKERYSPELSDPIKSSFNIHHTDEQLSDFYGLWFKYLFKYPGTYVQATMNNVYGYFYPEAQSWVTYYTIAPTGEPYGLTTIESLDKIRIESTNMIYIVRSLPGLGMLTSIGFYVWSIIIIIAALIRFKDKKKILMLTPMLVLILTAIAGPANTMFRYVYPVILSAPIYIVVTGMIISQKKETEEL